MSFKIKVIICCIIGLIIIGAAGIGIHFIHSPKKDISIETPTDAATKTDAEPKAFSPHWKTENGKKYYEIEEGKNATGWQTLYDHKYYFDNDGVMLTGWQNILGKSYYFYDSGMLATGYREIDGRPLVFDDNGQIVSKDSLVEKIDAVPEENSSEHALYGIGGYTPDSEDNIYINQALQKAKGNSSYQIGFVLINIYTGKGFAYNCDLDVYSASCIKGPYIASLVSDQPELIERQKNNMIQILMYSDNKLYSSYRRTYGREHLKKWIGDLNIDEGFCTYNYPRISPRILSKLWVKNYFFFNTDDTGRSISSWYEQPNQSPVYTAIGAKKHTQSKAGWQNESKYASSNDGGIVYPDVSAGGCSAPYVIAICSNIPSNLESLEPLCLTLDQLARKTDNNEPN